MGDSSIIQSEEKTTTIMRPKTTKNSCDASSKANYLSLSKLLLRSAGLVANHFLSQTSIDSTSNSMKHKCTHGADANKSDRLASNINEERMETVSEESIDNSIANTVNPGVLKSKEDLSSILLENENECVNHKNSKNYSSSIEVPSHSLLSSSISESSYSSLYISIHNDKRNFEDNDSASGSFSDSNSDSDPENMMKEYDDGLDINFSIARSRIADDAANEALKRLGNCECWTLISVGCGSSAADAIHERDSRPIWQQGLNQITDSRALAPFGECGLQFSVTNVPR